MRRPETLKDGQEYCRCGEPLMKEPDPDYVWIWVCDACGRHYVSEED